MNKNYCLNIAYQIRQKKFLSKIFIFYCLIITTSCKQGPYLVENRNIRGFVIGKETCNTDESKDYWLIDFTYLQNPPKVGDTLFFNGTTYTNVLKTKEPGPLLKNIGLKVSIDYGTITNSKVTTTGCDIVTPITYPLKEFTIIYQGEIR